MGTLLTVLVGMKIDTATVENTMIMSQKNQQQNYHMIQKSHSWASIQRNP